MVPRQNSFDGPVFLATRVKMKGRIVSPTLFNVVVNNIIRTWMAMTVEDQRVVHDCLRETVGRCLGSSMPKMAWLSHANRTGYSTKLMSWLASPEGMAWRPTSPLTHNDMPYWRITGRNVGGGHVAEVHRGGIILPVETLKSDTMPRVWS